MAIRQQRYLYTDHKYEYTVEIIFTDDPKRSLCNLYKRWGIDEDPIDGVALTVYCENKSGSYIDIGRYALIFGYEHFTPNVIAHECTHLTMAILGDRSIDLPGKDGKYENVCWFVGHFTEMILDLAKQIGVPVLSGDFPVKLKKLGR